MFGKKETLEIDAEDVEVACIEIETLKAMIESSKERIETEKSVIADRLNFYNRMMARLEAAEVFCKKLLSASKNPES